MLLFLGDQIYADRVPRRGGSSGRGAAWCGDRVVKVADFAEYAHMYRESWGEPTVRWLLSTLPAAMVFDDHDVTTTG